MRFIILTALASAALVMGAPMSWLDALVSTMLVTLTNTAAAQAFYQPRYRDR